MDRKFSPVLLLAGIAALLISSWGLVGGSGEVADLVDLRWLFIVVALVVGLLLLVTPGRNRK